jgi:hypothetical protein
MRQLKVFESITANGFFTGASNDMGWAHAGSDDADFQAWMRSNASIGVAWQRSLTI